MIVFGSAILLAGVSQPLLLITISAALNGVVMLVYSVLLIKLNRGMLPKAMGLHGVRFGAVIWAVVFYGGFSLVLIYDQLGKLF